MTTLAPRPTLYRRPRRRLLGGVAGGIADHVGISPWSVRVLFIVLTFAAGLGVVLYGAYWIVVPTPPGDAGKTRFPQWIEWIAAGIAGAVALGVVVSTVPRSGLFVPAILAGFGGALIWRQANDTQRASWWRASRRSLSARPIGPSGRARLALGAMLVIVGAVVFLAHQNFSALRDGLLAMAVTAAGIALLTGPWWMRTVAELTEERRERIRSQERAELAAHVHDSVLQTLALIQRNASAPREVARLARVQERELRDLLYGVPADRGLLSDQLRKTAAEVEDSYPVVIDVVVVGDATVDDRLNALVGACREALVNAAKHSGSANVSLYAEVEEDGFAVFVRDRGTGFDPDTIGEDRQGVRNSIVARVERHGGKATIRSTPGVGTEVEIRMHK